MDTVSEFLILLKFLYYAPVLNMLCLPTEKIKVFGSLETKRGAISTNFTTTTSTDFASRRLFQLWNGQQN